MESNIRIGIDLGGTKIECLVLENGIETFRHRIPTQSEQGADHIISQIHHIYKQAVNHIDNKNHLIGICTPGSICDETQQLRNSNTTCLNGLALKEMIENKIDHYISIENDANCFALAEAQYGSAKDFDFVFGVIVGTGCGGGIVNNKQIRIGPNKIAGEWGHSILHSNGYNCYCGKNGCVEKYISGSGLEGILSKNNIRKTTQDFFLNFNKSKTEQQIYNQFILDFGQALANVINTLDPDVIVIGGGLSNISHLYTDGIQAVKQFVFSDSLKTPIIQNTLGDSAGVLGAALL